MKKSMSLKYEPSTNEKRSLISTRRRRRKRRRRRRRRRRGTAGRASAVDLPSSLEHSERRGANLKGVEDGVGGDRRMAWGATDRW